MDEAFARTGLLLGEGALQKLAHSRVVVFGLGGVGGYVTEALARSGVGALDLVDHDCISLTNINRQLFATRHTIGQKKVEIAKDRVEAINPACTVRVYPVFYLPETRDQFDFTQYDYVVDAIDTVTGKLDLIENAKQCGTPVISAMGAGNKTDPTAFRVADLYDTSVCPLARIMRRECRRRGIESLKVVYSKEPPLCREEQFDSTEELPAGRRALPGSVAFVPSVMGLILAGEVVKDLIGFHPQNKE